MAGNGIVTDIQTQKELNAGLTPLRMSEVVIYTKQFQTMIDWYEVFLGQGPTVMTPDSGAIAWKGNKGVAFFRVYADFPWSEVFGIFEFPELDTTQRNTVGEQGPGIHHFQFRIPTFDGLITKYERMAQCGIEPLQVYNHGPGTSMYYQDPDQNIAEFSAPNFDNQEDYLGYFQTEAYKRNFDGVRIDDMAEFARRFRSGVTREELVRIEV